MMPDIEDFAFETESWANRVASACIERYNALPRAGKPGANEWAPLAGIVAFITTSKNIASGKESSKARDDFKSDLNKACDDSLRSKNLPAGLASTSSEMSPQGKASCTSPKGVVTCVALGTGSKCLGGNELICGGVKVHDSHAEVLARRGFLRYLLHQAEKALSTGDSDVLEAGPAGCRVRPSVSFHAFVSEPPCGDAAIFPSDEHAQRAAKECLGKRRHDKEEESSVTTKRLALSSPKVLTVPENIQKEGSQEKSHHCDTPLTSTDTDNDPTTAKNFEEAAKHKHINTNLGDEPHHYSYQLDMNPLQFDPQEILHDTKGSEILFSGKVSTNSHVIIGQKTITLPNLPQDSSALTLASKDSKNKPLNAFEAIQRTTKEKTQEIIGISSQDSKAAILKSKLAPNERGHVTPTDVHRTGAKCVGGGVQDRHAPGAGYHVTGVVRTKPGRGDPTLSLSCSDKMARWHAVGIQGALLSLILPAPVRFRSVVHAGGVTWSAVSLRRALVERACPEPPPLALVQASLRSPAGRGDGARPCAAGVVWCDVPHRPHEVVARGLKQGVTKKAANTPAGRLKICRKEMAKEFVRVYTSALAQHPRLVLNATCLDKRIPDLSCRNLGLEVQQSKSDSQDCLNGEGQAPACAFSKDQCRIMRHKNLSARQSVDGKIFDAFNSEGDIGRNGLDSDNTCLADGDSLISSTAVSSGINVSNPCEKFENVSNCGQLVGNGGSVAEMFRKMTYAQLKATACDYQRRWWHVRESHFPGWSAKPSGLKDFVIDDE